MWGRVMLVVAREERSNKEDIRNCWQEELLTVLQIDGKQMVSRWRVAPCKLPQPSVTIRSAGVVQKTSARPFAGDCIVHLWYPRGRQTDAQNPWG